MALMDVFIGSSKEGEPIAKKVRESLQDYLKHRASFTVWSDNFFALNVSAFENICKKSAFYDFAVLIGTKDDASTVRSDRYMTMRDNVLFEYGVFSGAIGRSKTFILIEKGAKVPSDLDGITLPFFENDVDDLKKKCINIAQRMEQESKISRISLMPSTASAISYYQNFLKPVSNILYCEKRIVVGGSEKTVDPRTDKLEIILPSVLKEDLKPSATVFTRKHNYVEAAVLSNPRSYPFYYKDCGTKQRLLDIPTCLNSSSIAIDLFIGKDFVGETEEMRMHCEKEIINFKNTISYLIERDDYAKELVVITKEQEYKE